MRAVVFESTDLPLAIKDLPDPQAAAGDAVLKVLAVPVLGYAKNVFSGALPYPSLLPLVPGPSQQPKPLTIGVSCIGRIDSLGAGSVALNLGQLVFFDTTVRARDNSFSIMLQGLFAGEQDGGQKLQLYWRNGAFAEKVLVPIENVHILPEYLLERYSPCKLSILNTTLVPYGGLLAGNLEAGQRVMIQPATGHFGGAAVAVAIAMGASAVLAVGRNNKVLKDLVARFGPRVKPVIVEGNESDKDVYGSLEPVDMTLNMYPPGTPAANVGYGLSALKSGGTLVLMGGVQDDVAMPYSEMMLRNLVVKGQFMYPPSAVKKMIGLIIAGLLDLNAFDEKAFKIGDVLEAVEYSASKGSKAFMFSTVLEPST